MSHYPEARFLTSANAASQFVADSGREVAFAGRSNAGKSSAINRIVNRRQFARTSRTPGRTQLVNFFSLGGDRRLVDLPGYGFARVADATRRHWQTLLEAYFEQRDSLAGLILVVDIRRGLTDIDWQMIEYAEAVRLPVHVLLTKSDKLKRAEAARALRAARDALGDRATVQTFSATKRDGEQDARTVLDDFLAAKKAPERCG
ncbi:MAG: ribosome biogenesis GTP-binding protein YihA/YsxC [Woeseiaceae bacterium]|nr:ribosome biogenesis GTP-binding protein YihA/YsxC [Woeseiaceae bacterium]